MAWRVATLRAQRAWILEKDKLKKVVYGLVVGALVGATLGCGAKEEGDLNPPKTEMKTDKPAEKPTDDKAAANPGTSKPTDDKGAAAPPADKPTDDKAAAGN